MSWTIWPLETKLRIFKTSLDQNNLLIKSHPDLTCVDESHKFPATKILRLQRRNNRLRGIYNSSFSQIFYPRVGKRRRRARGQRWGLIRLCKSSVGCKSPNGCIMQILATCTTTTWDAKDQQIENTFLKRLLESWEMKKVAPPILFWCSLSAGCQKHKEQFSIFNERRKCRQRWFSN